MMNSTRPSPLSRTLALVPPVVALVAQNATGSIFLKIDTPAVTGESVDKTHSGWIDVSSVQFGIANPVSLGTGGITAGKATGSDITITKSLDRSSPALFLGCAQGTRFSTVTLELTTSGGATAPVTYYKITLSNVIISNLSTSSGGDRPSESVSLSFEKITTDYYLIDAKGIVPSLPTSTATWNFATNSTK